MALFIQGTEVTEEHIGSPVTYIPSHAEGDTNHPDSQRGHISSFNNIYVFVRYNAPNGAATRPEDLVWG